MTTQQILLPQATEEPLFATLLYTSEPNPEKTIGFTSIEKAASFLNKVFDAIDQPVRVRGLRILQRSIPGQDQMHCLECGSNWLEREDRPTKFSFSSNGDIWCVPCTMEADIGILARPESYYPSIPITEQLQCDLGHPITHIYQEGCICRYTLPVNIKRHGHEPRFQEIQALIAAL